MEQGTDRAANGGPHAADHASQVVAHHAQRLESVLRGYIHILDALHVATLAESAAMLNDAVRDICSSRPTGHPLRQLLGWAAARAHQSVDDSANAALLVLATDMRQQLGLVMATR
jgi:hypothetical protein